MTPEERAERILSAPCDSALGARGDLRRMLGQPWCSLLRRAIVAEIMGAVEEMHAEDAIAYAEAAAANWRRAQAEERERLHELLEGCHAAIDPEEWPEVAEAVVAELASCDPPETETRCRP